MLKLIFVLVWIQFVGGFKLFPFQHEIPEKDSYGEPFLPKIKNETFTSTTSTMASTTEPSTQIVWLLPIPPPDVIFTHEVYPIPEQPVFYNVYPTYQLMPVVEQPSMSDVEFPNVEYDGRVEKLMDEQSNYLIYPQVSLDDLPNGDVIEKNEPYSVQTVPPVQINNGIRKFIDKDGNPCTEELINAMDKSYYLITCEQKTYDGKEENPQKTTRKSGATFFTDELPDSTTEMQDVTKSTMKVVSSLKHGY